MRRLTRDEILGFASQPDAQDNIVKSVLSTLGPESLTSLDELFFLARLQGWREGTVEAVLAGIAHAVIREPVDEQGETSGQESLKSMQKNKELYNPQLRAKPLAVFRNSLLRARAHFSTPQKPAQPRHRGAVLGLREVKENSLTPLAPCLKPECE